MSSNLLYIGLILTVFSSISLATCSNSMEISQRTEDECGTYAYKDVKPLLSVLSNINQKWANIDLKDRRIEELRQKVAEDSLLASINNELRNQIQGLQDNIQFYQQTIEGLISHTLRFDHCDQYKNELAKTTDDIEELNKNIRSCQNELEKWKEPKFDTEPDNCVPFTNSSGIHEIHVPGIDSTFEVLCNSDIAGSGWTVIEQRVEGSVTFRQNWDTYREGFGNLKSDFFLGLEKIHRLTVNRWNELYIHMELYNGDTQYARYDRFLISDLEDKYRMSVLGTFSGNATDDKMRWHAYQRFTTTDNDNDQWTEGNCANYRDGGGYWFNNCVASYLHGDYFRITTGSYSSIYFVYPMTIKKLILMIRPLTYS